MSQNNNIEHNQYNDIQQFEMNKDNIESQEPYNVSQTNGSDSLVETTNKSMEQQTFKDEAAPFQSHNYDIENLVSSYNHEDVYKNCTSLIETVQSQGEKIATAYHDACNTAVQEFQACFQKSIDPLIRYVENILKQIHETNEKCIQLRHLIQKMENINASYRDNPIIQKMDNTNANYGDNPLDF